jgi:Fe-S cluster assembly ATP-binding protein
MSNERMSAAVIESKSPQSESISTLSISDLHASIPGREILCGVNLSVRAGEVHAVMGPNGSGKSTLSHVLLGRPGYEKIHGSVTIDGEELLTLPTWRRAQAGLFLGMQYPTEVPGVGLDAMLEEVLAAGSRATSRDNVRALMEKEAAAVGLDPRLLVRALNVDLSGGEKKRNETVQLAVLQPKFAILDEIDSGLDVDALRSVSERVKQSVDNGLGVIAITHYNRLLNELAPDVVHVFVKGRIVASGGPELALELEKTGYEPYIAALKIDDQADASPSSLDDLFA